MPAPKTGDTYTFNGIIAPPEDPKNPDAKPTRGPLGDVQPGTKVTVRETVDAKTKGAHNSREDAVVVEFDQPTVAYDDNGKPVIAYSPRAFSVSIEAFRTDFTKGA